MSKLKEIKPKIIKKDLAPRAVPDCTPEVAVTQYMVSKSNEHIKQKKPDWDVARLTPEMELVIARRKLEVASKELIEKWDDSKENRKRLDEQWAELRVKEQQLKQFFMKFNNFIKENEDKQGRSQQKIKEENKLQEGIDVEISELTAKVEELTEIKETMEDYVNKHKIYKDYLTSVIHESKDFQNVFNILNRFEALNENRMELSKQQETDLLLLETAQHDMVKLTENKAQVILGLNNQLAELQSRYDRAKAEALRWEVALSHIKNTAGDLALEQEQVKTSCWNMYQHICRRKGIPPTLEEHDVEQQLVYIKQTIKDLKKIVRIARRHASKEIGSTAVSPATQK